MDCLCIQSKNPPRTRQAPPWQTACLFSKQFIVKAKNKEEIWGHLHWLTVLAQQGSYTAAAAYLNVTKGAVSQRIADRSAPPACRWCSAPRAACGSPTRTAAGRGGRRAVRADRAQLRRRARHRRRAARRAARHRAGRLSRQQLVPRPPASSSAIRTSGSNWNCRTSCARWRWRALTSPSATPWRRPTPMWPGAVPHPQRAGGEPGLPAPARPSRHPGGPGRPRLPVLPAHARNPGRHFVEARPGAGRAGRASPCRSPGPSAPPTAKHCATPRWPASASPRCRTSPRSRRCRATSWSRCWTNGCRSAPSRTRSSPSGRTRHMCRGRCRCSSNGCGRPCRGFAPAARVRREA